jgi:hypothetical protein
MVVVAEKTIIGTGNRIASILLSIAKNTFRVGFGI